MRTVAAIVIWVVGASYSALCIWKPEIRPYLGHSRERKWGLIGCIGMAIAFWLPVLLYGCVIAKLIPDQYLFVTGYSVLLGFAVAFVGTLIDKDT